MNPLFSLQNISAGYDGRTVVKDVNLEIRGGEFCALLGLNGSGKTTLLKAACGLLPAGGGRCVVDGMDCTRFHERKRARYISYIPQRHSKLQGVSILDAVLMGLNPRLGMLESPSASHRELVRNALATMGLGQVAEEDFSRLSEGQKQLVILSRTLIQDTPVMLMDEPDSALDFLNRHRMLAKIRRIIHGANKAGLVTLHDPNSALAYCDRLILIHNGGIACELPLAGASREDVRKCLSAIYGEIDVLEHNGRHIMLQTR